MSTQNLQLNATPDSSGNVFPQSLEAALTLATATLGTTEGITINAPSGADIGLYGRFTVPDGYIGTPRLVFDCIVAEAANTLAFGVQIAVVSESETLDQAYEAEDTATQTTWTGYAAEDRLQVAVTLTPSSALLAGDTVYFFAYRDNSADNQTGAIHDVKLFFRWEGGAQASEDHGYTFEYLTAATARMALDTDLAVEDTAKVWITDGTDWELVSLSSTDLPLSLDLTTSGAGGIVAADAPEAAQGYDIYLICNAGGGSPALLAIDPGSDISLETLPDSRTHWSRLIWFISNMNGGTSDIIPFYQGRMGECFYADREVIVSGKTHTVLEALDLTDFIPSQARHTQIAARTQNSTTTSITTQYYPDASGNRMHFPSTNVRNNSQGYISIVFSTILPVVAGSSAPFYWNHTAAPNTGTDVWCLGWSL